MMKAIVAIAFLIAVASAQFCVDLVQDDVACEGFRANWPAKVCQATQVNVTSSTYCDVESYYTTWVNVCPVQNAGNSSFCDGTGYYTYGLQYNTICGSAVALQACTVDADCVAAPVVETPVSDAPITVVLRCFECCTFCFDNDTCVTALEAGQYSNDTATCSPCPAVLPPQDTPIADSAPTASGPVADVPAADNQPSGSAPTGSTPRPVNRTPNSASSVAASATLIVAAALLL
eukprot:TRINITY_DN315_c0_g1_i1.p1 TRINITY_DN315_c0_g1~~TRINITY_DN315_c0_g1_i1.p1  ORF type:complete len:233 (+),score=43.88 TRINITY_DN315_c0_g1_i1:98-796(+)